MFLLLRFLFRDVGSSPILSLSFGFISFALPFQGFFLHLFCLLLRVLRNWHLVEVCEILICVSPCYVQKVFLSLSTFGLQNFPCKVNTGTTWLVLKSRF